MRLKKRLDEARDHRFLFFFTLWVGLLLSTLSSIVSRPSFLASLLVQIHWSRCLSKSVYDSPLIRSLPAFSLTALRAPSVPRFRFCFSIVCRSISFSYNPIWCGVCILTQVVCESGYILSWTPDVRGRWYGGWFVRRPQHRHGHVFIFCASVRHQKEEKLFFYILSFMGWMLSNCHVSFIAVHFSFTMCFYLSLSFLHRMASFLV